MPIIYSVSPRSSLLTCPGARRSPQSKEPLRIKVIQSWVQIFFLKREKNRRISFPRPINKFGFCRPQILFNILLYYSLYGKELTRGRCASGQRPASLTGFVIVETGFLVLFCMSSGWEKLRLFLRVFLIFCVLFSVAVSLACKKRIF